MTLRTLAADPAGLAVGALVVAFAAYRAARLVTVDSLSERPREALFDFAYHDPVSPKALWRAYLYELLSCGHCIGVWAAIGFGAWWWASPSAFVVVVIAAAAGVQSAVTTLVGD